MTPTPNQAAVAAARLIDAGIRHDLTGLIDDDRVVAIARIIDRHIPATDRAGWQPLDSAPKDGTEVIGFREDQGVFVFRWAELEEFVEEIVPGEDHSGWWQDRWGWMDGELTPTHWMPLPQPPSAPSPTKV